ncbi:MAG: hypothetical protein AUI91_12765 [Acidobacteria bacterium 13_1_40CM_3_56_11]|nr:MAG: hypothetical protein AUI91_12765 [Acidobacteria bacterium 13_1_40CM_3_56_11]
MNMIGLLRIARIPVVTSAIVLTGWAGYAASLYLTTASHFEVKKFSVSGLKHMGENQLLAKAGFEAIAVGAARHGRACLPRSDHHQSD